METSRFEQFCQQIYSGECARLLKIAPSEELLVTVDEEATNDTDIYTALHSLQMSPEYLSSPEQSLLSLLHAKEGISESLSASTIGKLLFVEFFFDSMREDELLQNAPIRPLLQLKVVLSKLFICGKLFDHGESKIVETLVDTLSAMLMGRWGSDSELDARKRQENLSKVTDVLMKNYFDDTGLLERQMSTLLDEQALERQRIVKLENRNIETELGRMRLQHCEEVIADLYNSHFVKFTIPNSLYEILSGIWHDVLLRILLQKDSGKKYELLWKQAAQATGLMIRSVQNGAHLKSFFSRAENLDDDLAYIMGENKEKEEDIEQLVNVLRRCQKEMLESHNDDYIQPELIEKGRYFGDAKLSVSTHLKQKVSNLRRGSWYLLHPSREEKKIIKLVCKEEKYDCVLFSTLDGKLLGKSFDELVFFVTSGKLKPIQTSNFFNRHINLTLKKCWNLIEDKNEIDKACQGAALERKRELKKQADQQALGDKIIEVRRLREEFGKDKKVQEQLKNNARKIVALLTLGSWVNIENEGEAPLRAKLAVKFYSSGRLVFVDRSGQRVAEFSSKELEGLLVKGRVEIIQEGDGFSHTLSGVEGRLSSLNTEK